MGAETGIGPQRAEATPLASMRPRHDGRGNLSASSDARFDARLASMRPRHDGRGNPSSFDWPLGRRTSFNEAAPRWARKHISTCFVYFWLV